MKYQLIVFDIDDTLFDYKATETSALKTVCSNYGIDCHFDDIYKKYKNANNEAKVIIGGLGADNLDEFRRVRATLFLKSIGRSDISVSAFVETYLEYAACGILVDGVYETLSEITHITKVAATNGSTYPRKNKLMNSPIMPFFKAFYSSEEMDISKPNPVFFHRIVDELGFSKSQTLIVGDEWETDVEGALSSHIDVCWFNSKRRKMPIQNSQQQIYEINQFNQLLRIVEGESHG
jgi:HAD superfamily hydrolase (TIGR01549 family)